MLRGGARGCRRPLLGRAPLGGAGSRLASCPLGAQPGWRGAAQGRVAGARSQDCLHRTTRDGSESRGLSHRGHRPRPLLEVPGRRRRRRPRERPVRLFCGVPLCGPDRAGVRGRSPSGALGDARRPRHRRGVGDHRRSAPGSAALIRCNAIVGVEMALIAAERNPWHASFRLLERDERVFAVLLAVVMVGGLAALGFFPLRPRYSDIDLYWLVFCFAAYKVGIFALVTVNPRATRAYFICALAIDLLLVFVLLCLTGAGDSVFYLLFFPLCAVNAYYFGPWVGLGAAVVAGGLYAWSTVLVPPWVGWTPHLILAALAGLPAVTLGLVADRERRARGEVERLNDELTGTLSRLQTAQQELVVAERMATVGRLSLRIASRFDGEAVEIAVSDTGGGIPEEVGPRLFEQFFTTKPQGTGLGLSITRQIAEEHGGEVSWTNRAPLGATFTIRLPIKRVKDG